MSIEPGVLVILMFIILGVLFVFGAIGLAGRLLRGYCGQSDRKRATYECGELPVGSAWVRFNPRFFLLAVVFVIFDVEIAFIFPWAVAFRDNGAIAFLDMLVFVAILIVGYLWFWKLGELRWILPQNERSGEDQV